ncbi:MAG: leucine-rich repeat protein [Lawsonibacter sp.]|nr:leucine-rich repeat protein [Lawsonibacter sp.]
MKKTLSLLLALVLCLGLLPAAGAVTAGDFDIHDGVLRGYYGWENDVTIPDGVVSIGEDAFLNRNTLTSVVIPSSVTGIRRRAFWNCTSLNKVNIPYGVAEIGFETFYNCASLTSIDMPSTVTQIWPGAFSYCTGLTSVAIPTGVTIIERNSFAHCTNLASVEIPATVTSIEADAFRDCPKLMNVYFGGSRDQWNAINIDNIGAGNRFAMDAVIHCDEDGPGPGTLPNGALSSNWAKARTTVAVETGLAPAGLGGDYRMNITRAQFAAVTVKLYEAMSGRKAETTGENAFIDTNDPVVLQAADMGFVSGVGGGKFSPEALITREQAAVMLSAVYTRLGGSVPAVEATAFADNGSVASWAKSAVAFMNGKGVVTGVGNNRFDPKGSASIEQALLISLKMYETLK